MKMFELFLHALYNYKLGPFYSIKVNNVYKYLRRSPKFSPEEIKLLKFKKLKKLLIHAYENVPYYRELMSKVNFNPYDFEEISQLSKLPPLTKKEVKLNFDKLQANNFNGKYIEYTTGGSTGEPVKILRDVTSIVWTEASYWRGIIDWAGCKLLDKQVILLTFGTPTPLGKMRQLILNNHVFESFKIDEELIRKIKRHSPKCVMSYASNMYEFASLVDKMEEKIEIPVILTTGEMLFDYQRKFIEEKLNGKVYDYYGCNEIGSLAFEFDGKKFVTDEHVILESVDEDFNPVPSGIVGKFLLTDLDNYIMPLIRYENGDLGSILPPQIRPCNIPNLTLINNLEGRSQEFLLNKLGKRFSVVHVTSALSSLETVKQYQVIQNNFKEIIFKYVPIMDRINERDKEIIKKEFEKMLGEGILLKFERVSKLPKTRRGKSRVVISKVI